MRINCLTMRKQHKLLYVYNIISKMRRMFMHKNLRFSLILISSSFFYFPLNEKLIVILCH